MNRNENELKRRKKKKYEAWQEQGDDDMISVAIVGGFFLLSFDSLDLLSSFYSFDHLSHENNINKNWQNRTEQNGIKSKMIYLWKCNILIEIFNVFISIFFSSAVAAARRKKKRCQKYNLVQLFFISSLTSIRLMKMYRKF